MLSNNSAAVNLNIYPHFLIHLVGQNTVASDTNTKNSQKITKTRQPPPVQPLNQMMLTTILHRTKLAISKSVSRWFLCKSLCQLPDPLVLPGFYKAPKFGSKIAIYDQSGKYSFLNLFTEAQSLSSKLFKLLNGRTGERVLFLCPNDAQYVITIWAIWMAGQIGL